jgi:hypothetical protein
MTLAFVWLPFVSQGHSTPTKLRGNRMQELEILSNVCEIAVFNAAVDSLLGDASTSGPAMATTTA